MDHHVTAFDLGGGKNFIEIKDGLAGCIHEMEYRMPTNKERAGYRASLWERKGKKLINRTFQTQVKYGAAVCTGFKKGTFAINDELISSDPDDEGFREDWKDILANGRPDIFSAMSIVIFEASATPSSGGGVEIDPDGIEEEEIDAPLES